MNFNFHSGVILINSSWHYKNQSSNRTKTLLCYSNQSLHPHAKKSIVRSFRIIIPNRIRFDEREVWSFQFLWIIPKWKSYESSFLKNNLLFLTDCGFLKCSGYTCSVINRKIHSKNSWPKYWTPNEINRLFFFFLICWLRRDFSRKPL